MEDEDKIKQSMEVNTAPAEAKFELFPDLPLELRLKIWGYVDCLQPPILEVAVMAYFKEFYVNYEDAKRHPENSGLPADATYRDLVSLHHCMPKAPSTHFEPDVMKESLHYLKVLSPVRQILHACRESREEGLKKYKCCFDRGALGRVGYFNPSTDTLIIHLPFLDEERGSCQFLYNWAAASYYYKEPLPDLEMFSGTSIAIVEDVSPLYGGMSWDPGEIPLDERIYIVKKLDECKDGAEPEKAISVLQNSGIEKMCQLDGGWETEDADEEFKPLVVWDAFWGEILIR